MSGRDDFGPGLRRERERRGISLQAISDRTKISASLFAAMERNDFSRWPEGIFRRSFLRAYADAVGLDQEATVRRFLTLFPSPGDESRQPPKAPEVRRSTPHEKPRSEPHAGRPVLRLVPPKPVAPVPVALPARPDIGRRLAGTAVDLGIIATSALVARLFLGWMAVWPVVAVAAALVFVVSNVFLRGTLGAWLVRRSAASGSPGTAHHSRERGRAVEPQRAARHDTVRRVERRRSRY